jgi:hypothetical protein
MFNNDKLIELSEVCKQIRAKDIRTAMAWCKQCGLPIIQRGNRKLTYRILVDAELDQKMIQLLKKKHPQHWEELFEYYKSNDLDAYMMATKEEIPNRKQQKISKEAPQSSIARAFSKT